jgi:Ca-activated chloride channel family protein
MTNKEENMRVISCLRIAAGLLLATGVLAGCVRKDLEEAKRVRFNEKSTDVGIAASAPAVAMESQFSMPARQPLSPSEFNTEGYDRIGENPFLDVLQNPLSTFSIDVDTASYANIRRFINNGSLPPPDAVRIEEMVNYFDYRYPQPRGEVPFSFNAELTDAPWQAGNRLLLIGLQGASVPTENLPPANLVFLVDVSGSMEDANKLPLLVRSFKLLVEQLRPVDRVAIVVYAGQAGLVLPSTSGNDKEKILAALDSLSAGGSTAGGEGIKLAYRVAEENFVKGGNNRVILATDGDFNVGASSDAEMERLIEEKRKSGVFLSALGFGMGNYKDSKMQKLADRGNGNYAYIDTLMEARKVLVSQFGGTMMTIAKDVKLQLEFNPSKVKSYRLIGYEKRMLRPEDFADDKKDAGELGSGHTVTALYEIEPVKGGVTTSRELTYQTVLVKDNARSGSELATIRFRYKKPDGEKSVELVRTIPAEALPLDKAGNNFRFAAAVAEWGMLLRNSEFKGNASASQVLRLARGSRGADERGYRAEFIRLVETAELLRHSARPKVN